MNRLHLPLLAASLLATPAIAAADQIFTPVDVGFQVVMAGSACWGDYDGDGRVDLFVCGEYPPYEMPGIIYRNEGNGGFTPAVSLAGITLGDAAWGDYDSDGDLDLVITGLVGPLAALTMLYRNDGDGLFEPVTGVLPHVCGGAAAWGDYDNDGDPDLLLAGYGAAGSVSYLLRNDGGGSFVQVSTPFFGMWLGGVSWADYDGDGDLDALISGEDSGGDPKTRLYRNVGNGVFVESGSNLLDLLWTSMDWGDFDNDGDLDLLVTGYSDHPPTQAATRLYRNDGGTLVEIPSGLPNMGGGHVQWGDFDNDGLLDVLIAGSADGSGDRTYVFRNEGGTFVQAGEQISWCQGQVAWADYDDDGDLDFVGLCDPSVLLYRNDGGFPANTPPSAPGSLHAQPMGDAARLTWSAATDNETPAAGLNYNLRVGTLPGGLDVLSPLADPSTGRRLLPARGNAGPATELMLTGLAPGVYYWSVQAVDGAFAGSPFAEEALLLITGSDVSEREVETRLPIRQIAPPGGVDHRITLEFELPQAAYAEAILHDLAGRALRTVFAGQFEAGRHQTSFDPGTLEAGIYFCSLRSGGISAACKVAHRGAGPR